MTSTMVATGKHYHRMGQLFVVVDDGGRLIGVGVLGSSGKTACTMMSDGRRDTITVRARWCGPPGAVGDYLVSRHRPRLAYRIAVPPRRCDAKTRGPCPDVRLEVERVSLPLPRGAVAIPWRWDNRGRNTGVAYG